MSLLDTLAARFGFTRKADDPRPPATMLSVADGYKWDLPDAMLAEKQANLYAALSWISIAIDRTADIAATGVFSVKRIAGEPGGADDEDLPNHDFEKLLRRPNPSQSRGEFLRDGFTMFKVTGNLYLHLNTPSEGTPPLEMWIVPTQLIKPIPDGNSYVSGYEFTAPGKAAVIIPKWQILHLKTSNPTNPFVGLSAIQSLALDAYGDLAQQKWNLAFFDKNNAKLPQILAFKHTVADPEWNKIKAERDREWGGTNRSGVTLLRGVGDTLQLIQATATQEQMEFLESRRFTKEEIYDKLAPGLASVLAVNATEANAIAGKSTLIEFGVWPVLDQMGQKFTSDLLPLYEENLDGEFDDMRQTNRILDMEEQVAYERTHTVNEVRAEYYDEGPLELDPEVMKQIEAADAEQEELDANAPPPAAVPAAPAPFGGKAALPVSKLDPRGFLFPAQISPTTPNPADVAKPAPPPPALVPGQPPVTQPEGDAVPDQAAVGDELAKWEKFAVARVGKGGRPFEPRAVDYFTAGRITTALKSAKTATDVRRVFEKERSGDELADAAAELKRFNDYIYGPSKSG